MLRPSFLVLLAAVCLLMGLQLMGVLPFEIPALVQADPGRLLEVGLDYVLSTERDWDLLEIRWADTGTAVRNSCANSEILYSSSSHRNSISAGSSTPSESSTNLASLSSYGKTICMHRASLSGESFALPMRTFTPSR